ncbi:uncharacterized protein LOC142357476 [Convolutriloba macropyga]|uniref:uncharacterized protein LOC142357476 n=1 Tax=Convolutriloba macropyga TaxID=536237 RepID=UPI003F5283E2
MCLPSPSSSSSDSLLRPSPSPSLHWDTTQQAAVTTWEEKHKPYALPDDYKSFLQACNGMKLKWSIEFRGSIHPLACMNVNGLEDLSLVPLGSFPKDDQGPNCTVRLHDDHADSSHKSDPVAAFDLDATCQCGAPPHSVVSSYFAVS